jgi:S-methylmethionine-dependent homocysteine/selenocysteine methylase
MTCVTDGGMETTLLFDRGIELPCFATFPLLASSEGTEELRRYFEPYVALSAERGLTAVLDTPTWRANADWGAKLGYDAGDLAEANRKAVALLEGVRAEAGTPVVISGCLGPRDDAYRPRTLMTTDSAERYHSAQIATLSDTAADLIMHFAGALEDGAPWVERLGGLRVNASRKSHAELDESEELDEGDPAELAERHRLLHPACRT